MGDEMKGSQGVTLELTSAEALVLFELLSRWEETDAPSVPLMDHAEWEVLWRINGRLESALAEPFRPDYLDLLERARDSLRDKEE